MSDSAILAWYLISGTEMRKSAGLETRLTRNKVA